MATTAKPTPDQGAPPPRHTPYPYYSLQKAIEVAAAIADLGGANSEVSKSLIAHRFQLEEDSPSLVGILGAAKLYGLIDGRGSYRLTETAKKYFYPTAPGEKQVALLRMAKSPPLFSALIDRFDGSKLPPTDSLINILHRDHHIAQSWRPRAVSLFISAVRDAQMIDAAGFVRYRASIEAAANGNSVGDSHAPPPTLASVSGSQTVLDSSQVDDPPVAAGVDVWSFRIGSESVRLETSHELSMAAWKKLNQYVQVLKPTDEESA